MNTDPYNKILNSLKCGKMLGAGQSLKVLSKVGFGDISDNSIKKTQKILYKMSKEYKVKYFRETNIWYLLEDI